MIAFTSSPAIKVRGLAFSSEKKMLFADDVKYRITAPALIPMDIYRRDSEEGVIPAPDGVHETTDGLLVTTKDGVVELIEEKTMPVEEVEVENQFASLEQFDALRAANEELAAKIATLETALISVLGKVEETFSVFEKFASATPALCQAALRAVPYIVLVVVIVYLIDIF